MKKQAVESIELKEACVLAAHRFIASHGVERLSLREVARLLGVSHQAPYKHYPSRDHLLAEVIRRCFQQFAAYLDDRGEHKEPHDDLRALGQRYLSYAAQHPLEYRLMFGTAWPEPAEQVGLVKDAVHAFDVLRRVLRTIYGSQEGVRAKVDLDAMFIWSNLHGLASISESNVMDHLQLAKGVSGKLSTHIMEMMGESLRIASPARKTR
jgi:AcrR family transcriptional regulator